MNQWKVVFSVNNVRTEQIVTSPGSFEAQKIIKSQYVGQNVQIRYVVPTK
ncbi:MAG: hypothetical protein IJF20_02500 [Clostridia bacterium]|nr:hypothetical protein [Clostridia bacterium]